MRIVLRVAIPIPIKSIATHPQGSIVEKVREVKKHFEQILPQQVTAS
jgi:hypothetical protein